MNLVLPHIPPEILEAYRSASTSRPRRSDAERLNEARGSLTGYDCPVCRNFSRAYVRHLFTAGEMLGLRLAVMHNLYFYNKLMERIRQALDEGTFQQFRAEYSEKLAQRMP